jgi:hypothetical protein
MKKLRRDTYLSYDVISALWLVLSDRVLKAEV